MIDKVVLLYTAPESIPGGRVFVTENCFQLPSQPPECVKATKTGFHSFWVATLVLETVLVTTLPPTGMDSGLKTCKRGRRRKHVLAGGEREDCGPRVMLRNRYTASPTVFLSTAC